MFSTLGYWICYPFAWLTRAFYNLTGSYGWLTYEYVIPVTGQYVITWNLHKDNSPVDGSNKSWVDNLVVESQSTSPVEGVNVTPETAEMYTGGQLALNAEVYPSNVADASVSWSSLLRPMPRSSI